MYVLHAFGPRLISSLGKYLEEQKIELAKLEDIVKAQNFSAEDVLQMNTEHDSLVRTLDDLRKKISDVYQNILHLEVLVNNRGSAAEEALDSYNYLLSDLGLFPPLPHPYEDLDLTLELKTGTSNLDELLMGADIHTVIKPTLTEIAEAKRSERRQLENERIQYEHEHDQVLVTCDNLEAEINAIDADVGALNQQAEELRDVCASTISIQFGIDSFTGYSKRSIGSERRCDALAKRVGTRSYIGFI